MFINSDISLDHLDMFIDMFINSDISLDHLDYEFRHLSGDLIRRTIRKPKKNNKRANHRTRSVIYISIFSRFPSNTCRNRGFQTIPISYAGDRILVLFVGTIFREVLVASYRKH